MFGTGSGGVGPTFYLRNGFVMQLQSKTTNAMWGFKDAIGLVRATQPMIHQAGYHIALAGGVLNKGESNHDLDIIIMPMNRDGADRSLERVWRIFEFVGVTGIAILNNWYPAAAGRTIYRGYQNDSKQIDFFVYEEDNAHLTIPWRARVGAAIRALKGRS